MNTEAAREQGTSAHHLSPFTLALLLHIVLGLLTVSGYLFAGVEQYLAYRILALGIVLSCLVPVLAASLRQDALKGLDEAEKTGRPFRPGLGLWISSAFLALVAVHTVLTFFFPVLLDAVRIRILNFAAIAIYMLCYLGLEKTVGTQKIGAALEGGRARPESLARRFFTSLSILLLLPIYFALVNVYPSLQKTPEMTVAVFGIIGGAMIGLWSVSRDILELLKILRKARRIASHQTREVLDSSRQGEVSELADAFNVVISELGETISELQTAKERIELLLDRIGTAVASSESMQDLLRLVLDISRDSLGAKIGYLHILESPAGSGELYATSERGAILAKDELQRKLDAVAESASPCQEGNFLALPLLRGSKVLGVLAVEREKDDHPFDSGDMDLLQSVANQAALAVEAVEIRESDERIYLETISALALAIEAKDPYTRGHSKRVSELAAAIALRIGLGEEDVQDVRCSGLLHDIGKLGVPDSCLRKAAALSEAEYDLVKQHPVTGERIVNAVTTLRKLASGVRHHHERVDGQGYPDGLRGDEVDKKALIIGAADALDAMLSDRPYRHAFSLEQAEEEIRKGSGTQFDADVALALLELLDENNLPLLLKGAV